MAVTKIWAIKEGSRIECVVDYVMNEDKTKKSEDDIIINDDIREYTAEERSSMLDVIEYAAKDYKTDEQRYVSGINCDPTTAREDFLITKKLYRKENKIILWHGIQSFKPGEIEPGEAHTIGLELAKNLWGEKYEVLVCTHIDREHIHNHFVINSVSFVDGKKIDCKWQDMARESDRLCEKYCKSVIDERNNKGKSYAEYINARSGNRTWTDAIKEDIDDAIQYSRNINDFYKILRKRGYFIKSDTKYFTLKPPGKERYVRIDRRLGEEYSLLGIANRIHDNVKNNNVKEYPTKKKYYCRNAPYPKVKLKGYRALYYRYLYQMGTLPKRTIYPASSNYIYREEIIKLNRISKNTRFLSRYKVETTEELEYVKSTIISDLRNLREKKKYYTEQYPSQDIVKKIDEEIKKKEDDLVTANDIKKRSVKLQTKVESITKENQQYKQKER